MPKIRTNVAETLHNKRIVKMIKRARKESVSKYIQRLGDAVKEYEESFARLKNMNNQQWRTLIRDPERFETLKQFLAESPRHLRSWKKDIKDINSSLDSLQGIQRHIANPLTPGTVTSGTPGPQVAN